MHSVNPSKPKNLLEVVNELVDGMNKAIKALNRDFPENSLKPDSPLLLTGELASDPEIIKLMQEATGHPVDIIKPRLEMPPDMSASLYAASLGLISKKLKIDKSLSEYNDIDINLFVKVQKGGRTKQQLAYAGILVVILLLGALLYKANDMKLQAVDRTDQLQATLNKTNQALVDAQKTYTATVATKTAESAKFQALSAELAAYTKEHTQINSLQNDYATPINVINQALPEGANYKSLQLQPAGVVVQGEVIDPIDVIKFTTSLEKTKAFKSVMPDNIAPVEATGGATFTVTLKK
jgi:hypothetical protein